MAAKMNHARHAHRGRETQQAFFKTPAWARHTPAKAANAGRSLSAEEVAAHLKKIGLEPRNLTVVIAR